MRLPGIDLPRPRPGYRSQDINQDTAEQISVFRDQLMQMFCTQSFISPVFDQYELCIMVAHAAFPSLRKYLNIHVLLLFAEDITAILMVPKHRSLVVPNSGIFPKSLIGG